MNKPPDNEELKRECSYPCGIHSVPTLDHSMYDGAKKIRDQWKAANEKIVERSEKIRSLTLSLRAYHSALTSNEIDNQLAEIASINEQLIKELTASEKGSA